MRVAFLGLGLIGGSVARALRDTADRPTTVAWTPDGRGPRSALAAGVIDRATASPTEAVAGADLVVLAAPPPAILGLLDDLAGPWHDALDQDAVITDVASSKAAIVARAAALRLRFVGGHPMAGRETSGFDASTTDLLRDAPWVIVEPDGADDRDPEAVARVEDLAIAVGARPVTMHATAHDDAVAAISHLPLVASIALVEAVVGGADGVRGDWQDAALLASSGWRDMTRLARGDVAMGTGIVVTNGPAIATRVRDLVEVLEAWAAILERPDGPDPDAVAARLAVARERAAGG